MGAEEAGGVRREVYVCGSLSGGGDCVVVEGCYSSVSSWFKDKKGREVQLYQRLAVLENILDLVFPI